MDLVQPQTEPDMPRIDLSDLDLEDVEVFLGDGGEASSDFLASSCSRGSCYGSCCTSSTC